MDVGNVYRHAYDNVSEDAVWRTVRQRLPELLAAIEEEIAGQPQPSAVARRGPISGMAFIPQLGRYQDFRPLSSARGKKSPAAMLPIGPTPV
jgi:hypothetical protein